MKKQSFIPQKTPSVFWLFLLVLTPFSPVFSQKLMHIKHSCSFDGTETETAHYVDEPSREANQIVEKIMRANVLPQNFIIKAANCKNALATTEGSNRYILYSTNFLENFKKEANSQWAAYCVLAHEIGHHLSNHNLSESENSKRKVQELQADKYAGGVLFRLGATLDQAQAGIRSFSLESETTTHPNKNARLEAVAQGWKQAQETQGTTAQPPVVAQKDKPETNFTAVSDLLKTDKILGKWATGEGIYQVFTFNKDGTATLTSTFKIGGTTQTTPYKWSIKNGILTRQKVFTNGSLGSPEQFVVELPNDNQLILKTYNRWGEAKDPVSWARLK